MGRAQAGEARGGATGRVACLASRPRVGAAEREQMAGLVAGVAVDWEALEALAGREGLGPLWHGRLVGLPGVPEWFVARLRTSHLAAVAAGVRAAADLGAALDALAAAGVGALALKGPVLVEELFGEAASLPAADLDLLVRPERVGDAVRALAALGYLPERDPDAASLRVLSAVDLHHPGGRSHLDCHWRLGHPRHFPGPEGYWWEAARTRRFHGRDVPVPGAGQSLLFGALHLFKHGFRGLRQLAVFGAMEDLWRGRVDWDALEAAARAFGADRSLLAAVHLAHALFDIAPPAALLPQLDAVGGPARRVLARLEAEALAPRLSPGAVRFAAMSWQHGPSGAAVRLARWVVPPAEEVRLRYEVPQGSPWLWWHYLANPVRLFRRRGR